MNKKQRRITVAAVAVWFVCLMVYYLHHANFQVLNPKGVVAERERNLIIFTVLLGLLVVVPVYIMTFTIAWKYREGNHKADYRPDWDHSVVAEGMWWAIPTVIIVILSVVTWTTSHSLNPPKALSSQPPVHIQVVALDWRWLFIYPDQGIATINYVQMPVSRPVQFEITSNGPMNSFWIPQLGSQIYAMAGMSTHLNLEASQPGDFRGSSANLSGAGFSGMDFTAHAGTSGEFGDWVTGVHDSEGQSLTMSSFKKLAQPSTDGAVAYYPSVESDLYSRIQAQFQLPGGGE